MKSNSCKTGGGGGCMHAHVFLFFAKFSWKVQWIFLCPLSEVVFMFGVCAGTMCLSNSKAKYTCCSVPPSSSNVLEENKQKLYSHQVKFYCLTLKSIRAPSLFSLSSPALPFLPLFFFAILDFRGPSVE